MPDGVNTLPYGWNEKVNETAAAGKKDRDGEKKEHRGEMYFSAINTILICVF